MDALFIEIGVVILYLLFAYIADRAKKIDLLIYSTLFAAFFENLHVLQFSNSGAGYIYGHGFRMIFIFTPLFVILAWGVIITSSYILAKKLTKNRYGAIFLAPIFATMVDFAMEFVAVRMGFWEWRGFSGIGLEAVPYSNFVGWLSVSLGFLIVYELFDRKWLSCFLGYISFIVVAGVFYLFQWIFGIGGQASYIFVIASILLLLMLYFHYAKDAKTSTVDISKTDFTTMLVLRSSFYLFAAMYMMKLSLFSSIPVFMIFIAATLSEILVWYFSLRHWGGKKAGTHPYNNT